MANITLNASQGARLLSGEYDYLNESGSSIYWAEHQGVSTSSTEVAVGSSLSRRAPSWVISGGKSNLQQISPASNATSSVVPSGSVEPGDLQTSATYTVGALSSTGAITATGGVAGPSSYTAIQNLPISAATTGTDTTPADGTQFVTPIFVPFNKTLTGAAWLVGSVGGTDRTYVVLYSSAGAVLANSVLTSNGTVAGTTATWQELDFTATYAAKGPALYYVGVSIKGNTARLRTAAAVIGAPLRVAGQVSQTHATVAAITPPATFTADKAPYVYLY